MRHQTRVSSVALAVLATSAIACGDTQEAATRTPDSTRAPSTKSAVPVEVPLPLPRSDPNAVTIASALAPYERFVGTDAAPGEFPRTIRHAMREARIEQAPVRVVTLNADSLDTMVELGIKPVGVVDHGGKACRPPSIRSRSKTLR